MYGLHREHKITALTREHDCPLEHATEFHTIQFHYLSSNDSGELGSPGKLLT
jgi:hypothetical protein